MLGTGRKEREQELAQLLADSQARVAQLEIELRGWAERDPVTGLATLERFRMALELELRRARRHGQDLAVAVLDVDDFRALMARHGHAAADGVLREVGRVLEDETRPTDVACRAGGDEFAVLMPETDLPGAAACCERILRALEGSRAGAIEGISVSAGIAIYDRAQAPSEALGEAYVALDHSRRLGGHRVTAGPASEGAETAEDAEQRDAVSALAVTLLERDRYTGEHSESVLAMVEKVAHGLGLDEDEVERIKAAALLHDIGKVAIPDAILNKPGPLTDEEWKLMKAHTVVGERILRAIPGLGGVARIVRHEHVAPSRQEPPGQPVETPADPGMGRVDLVDRPHDPVTEGPRGEQPRAEQAEPEQREHAARTAVASAPEVVVVRSPSELEAGHAPARLPEAAKVEASVGRRVQAELLELVVQQWHVGVPSPDLEQPGDLHVATVVA